MNPENTACAKIDEAISQFAIEGKLTRPYPNLP